MITGFDAPVLMFNKILICLSRYQIMAAFSETEVQFWMTKAVSWGDNTSCLTLLDTSRHLNGLRSFLQQLLQGLQQMVCQKA